MTLGWRSYFAEEIDGDNDDETEDTSYERPHAPLCLYACLIYIKKLALGPISLNTD